MASMFKSAVSAAAQAGVLAVVTSTGAIVLRLYSLAYRIRRPLSGGSPLSGVNEIRRNDEALGAS